MHTTTTMLVAALAIPEEMGTPNFEAGRQAFNNLSVETQISAAAEVIGCLIHEDPEMEAKLAEVLSWTHATESESSIRIAGRLAETAVLAGHHIIEVLKHRLAIGQIASLSIAGYTLYLAGGPSPDGDPSGAAAAIQNACKLPSVVLQAMGVIEDFSQPLARKNGSRGHVTDTDIVDAIALGLGTRPEWEGAAELEWIADAIGYVRSHPGDQDPVEYVAEFSQKFSMDPGSDNFLSGYIDDEAYADDEDPNNESDVL